MTDRDRTGAAARRAPPSDVWDAVTGDGWLADEVELDLRPGGDAGFRSEDGVKTGWVEEAVAPRRRGPARVLVGGRRRARHRGSS